MTMKTSGKKRALMFGDFIAAAYKAGGKRRGNELVRAAVNTRLIVFQGRQHFVITDE